MTGPKVLVSTWSDGLFVIEGGKVRHELAGRQVRGLAAHDDGSVLAIVDTGKLCRRGRDGAWAEIAESQSHFRATRIGFDRSRCFPKHQPEVDTCPTRH